MDPICTSVVEQLSSLPVRPDGDTLIAKLEALMETLGGSSTPDAATPALLSFLERNPQADLGMPGPLVRFIERSYPRYLEELLASVERRPTATTVWMLNRILNGKLPPEIRERLLAALTQAVSHPQADSVAISQAQHFLQLQLQRLP